ncbi:YncE family protein [Terracidiphilus gabretensis]|uniref:YncE family protein n=1 Tax=Terracidiphilus gabretensis TaxID=1577687 RepID=UPI0012F7436A|nr:YncE family protein [Terracidiphilus gabretensis]
MSFCFSVLLRRALAGATLIAVLAAPALVAAQGPYKVVDKWKLGGEGGWDYLTADGAAHRLYITRGMRVDVVDTGSGKIVGTIGGLHGVHGVALDDAGKYGYISDGGGNAVVVFDRGTLATIATIPAGTGPDAILFEPVTKTVWAFNGRSKDATVIDTATQKVVATMVLGGKPEFPAADGKGSVYDNIEDKSEIVKIDAKTKTITATWPAGCEGPSGLAIDREGGKLFAVCDKTMSVIDVKTGKVLATPAIGDGPDAAGFSAKHKLAFASCGEGVVSVVDGVSLKTVQTVTTEKRARTMAYDPVADRIYTVTADFGAAPAATAQNPRPRPPVLPDSFRVIVIGN